MWLRNAAAASAAVAVLLNPTYISKASDKVPAPQLSPATIARLEKVERVRTEVSTRMTQSPPQEAKRVADAIVDECDKTGVDPLFVLAIIESESGFNTHAISAVIDRNGNPKANAIGLMQLLPSTAREMGVSNIFDPADNVRGGIRYIRHLWGKGFGRRGGPESVLLAYNQGPKKAIEVFKEGSPMPDEAQVFVPRVMAKYRSFLVKHGYKAKDAKRLFLVVS